LPAGRLRAAGMQPGMQHVRTCCLSPSPCMLYADFRLV
jgi:hypothetical protein